MELKLISFNIRGRDDENGNSVAERAPRLYKIVSKYSPDLLGLQEYRPTWDEHFEKSFLNDYEMYNQYRTSEGILESSPLLWKKGKFECIKKGSFWLSDTPDVESGGWDEKYHVNRICSYVVLKEKQTGKQFAFMNTHFGFGDECQKKSANLIVEYSKKISDFPTVCMGDFNMYSDSVGYGELIKYFTDLNKATANDDCATFHGYNPEKKIDKKPIDFFFIDSSVKPVDYRVIKDLVDSKYPSDHYGICGIIEI